VQTEEKSARTKNGGVFFSRKMGWEHVEGMPNVAKKVINGNEQGLHKKKKRGGIVRRKESIVVTHILIPTPNGGTLGGATTTVTSNKEWKDSFGKKFKGDAPG